MLKILSNIWQKINKRVLFTVLSASFIIGGTFIAILYAKGNRPTLTGDVRNTGLLVVNSFPTGAQVYVNGKLTSATDDTLNLDPGTYEVEIRKEGYTSWKKSLNIEKELVTQTNAVLFPSVPSLSPLTFTGVQNLSPAPDGQKLIYYTASASSQQKNGLYLVDLTDSPLSLQRGSRQVVIDTGLMDLQTANIIWSPDSSEVLLSDDNNNFLIDITKVNNLAEIRDVSLQKSTILSSWEEEMYLRERQILSKFPLEIVAMATQSATNVYFSPDQEMLLYTATSEVTLPDDILPNLPASNTQQEKRTIIPGEIYVYDRKEDKNFFVGTTQVSSTSATKALLATDLDNPRPVTLESSPSAFRRLQATQSALTATNFKTYHSALFTDKLQWFPDSRHLIRISNNGISIVEYDNTNEVVLYSGPFDPEFVYPWSDGDKLLITTSFNQPSATEKNLYAIQLR